MAKMNESIVVATVEDWTGRELIKFNGEGCAWKAIEWREDQARMAKTEEEEDGILEDLYVVGYDKNGDVIGVQFG